MRHFTVTSFNPDRCAIEVHRGDYPTLDDAMRHCPVRVEHVVSDEGPYTAMYWQGYSTTTQTWWTVYGPGY
jgi:hypothetical protein